MIRLAVVAFAALVAAAPSDAAGPTDFRTTVVSVTPPTEGIDVAVIGGDSFLELTAEPGVDVVVLGYQQEPYLHFRPDGVVEENERSPTAYLNADRYGGGEVPAGADATLPPNWRQVGSGGRYAWHDHRAHWMDPEPADGRRTGDADPGGDGPAAGRRRARRGRRRTDWLPAPSRLPLAVGAAVGLGLVLLAVAAPPPAGVGAARRRRRGDRDRLVAVPLAARRDRAAARLVAAPGAGHGVACSSPSLLGWRLRVVRPRAARRAASWRCGCCIRRDGAFRAIIPTDAPFWLDRAVMAGAAVVAVIAARRRGGGDVPPP